MRVQVPKDCTTHFSSLMTLLVYINTQLYINSLDVDVDMQHSLFSSLPHKGMRSYF